MKRALLIAPGVLVPMLIWAPATAHADLSNKGVLDDALQRFRRVAEGWGDASAQAAAAIFWSLAVVSLAWTMAELLLKRADAVEILNEFFRFVLFVSFWAFMLDHGPEHARMIVDAFYDLGNATAHRNSTVPSDIVDVGFFFLGDVLQQSSILSPVDSAISILLAICVLVTLTLVAANLLVVLVSCWFVAYGGLVILGFGSAKWTNDMARNYYRTMLSLGLEVFALILLVGAGEKMLMDYYQQLDGDVSLQEQAAFLVVALLLRAMVNRVPQLVGGLVTGSSAGAAVGSGTSTGHALAAVATARSAMAQVHSAAAGAASASAPAAKVALGAGMIGAYGAMRSAEGIASLFGQSDDGGPSSPGGAAASGHAGQGQGPDAGQGSAFEMPAPHDEPAAPAAPGNAAEDGDGAGRAGSEGAADSARSNGPATAASDGPSDGPRDGEALWQAANANGPQSPSGDGATGAGGGEGGVPSPRQGQIDGDSLSGRGQGRASGVGEMSTSATAAGAAASAVDGTTAAAPGLAVGSPAPSGATTAATGTAGTTGTTGRAAPPAGAPGQMRGAGARGPAAMMAAPVQRPPGTPPPLPHSAPAGGAQGAAQSAAGGRPSPTGTALPEARDGTGTEAGGPAVAPAITEVDVDAHVASFGGGED